MFRFPSRFPIGSLVPAAFVLGALAVACSDPVYQKAGGDDQQGSQSDKSSGSETSTQSPASDDKGSSGATKSDGGTTMPRADGGGTGAATDCSKTTTRQECLSCCFTGIGNSAASGVSACLCNDKCKASCGGGPLCGGDGDFKPDCAQCLQDNAEACIRPVANACTVCESKPG